MDSAIVYVSEAPRIEVNGGVAKIVSRSGGTQLERAMSISCFGRFIERGQRALIRHAAGDAIIIIDD